MFRRMLILSGWWVSTVALVQVAGALELHVSPKGSDDNAGTRDAPLATLEGARDAIRALRLRGPLAEPIRVVVADGRYNLDVWVST